MKAINPGLLKFKGLICIQASYPSAECCDASLESKGRGRFGGMVKPADEDFINGDKIIDSTASSHGHRGLSSIKDYFSDCFAIVTNRLKLGL